MRRFAPAAALLLAAAALSPAQTLKGIQAEFAEVGEATIPATVIVRSPDAKDPRIWGSSGVILNAAGYVLSDADATLFRFDNDEEGKPTVKVHGRTARIRLPAPDHRVFDAVVVKRDPETDTTLLRITDPPPKDLPVIPPGSSDRLTVGSFTVVVGNAFGTGREGEPALSLGIVSGLLPAGKGTAGKYQTIYTSAAVNPGNNGGPCVNAEGRLVGIISTFEADPKSPFRALGIVTPIDRIRARYRDVKDFTSIFPEPEPGKPASRAAALLEEAFRIAARAAGPSLVGITIDRGDETGAYTVRRPVRTPRGVQVMDVSLQRYLGPYSGVVVSREGHILTSSMNLWGFEKIKSVTVHLPDGRALPAKVLGRDLLHYLAMLKVESAGLTPLPPAGPAEMVVGRIALAMGRPFEGGGPPAPLMSFGIIGGLDRHVREMFPEAHAIHTDAALNDALVGGALVTIDGKLLGINLLVNPDTYGRRSGIGFAVPLAGLEKSLARLRRGRDLRPAWMGLGLEAGKDGKGIVFVNVKPDGPAGKAGIRSGDILLSADGRAAKEFATIQDFVVYVRGKGAGAVLTLVVDRAGEEKTFRFALGARPGS